MKEIQEKAKSKSQQQLFGMVSSVQKGKMDAPSEKIAKMAEDIDPKEVDKFAETKHKGLPDKVAKEQAVVEQVTKKVQFYKKVVGWKR